MTTLTATTLGTIPPEFTHSLDSGVDKKRYAPQIINVKDYGAVGDGVAGGVVGTDDTDAIQAALDAAFGGPFPAYPSTSGGNRGTSVDNFEVYFPPGKYVVTRPLVICGTEGGLVRGAGADVTTILFRATGTEGNDIIGFYDPNTSTHITYPSLTPLWIMDGWTYSTMSDMTWTGDLADMFITKVTNADSNFTGEVDEDVLHFADTSDIVIGSTIHHVTRPDAAMQLSIVTAVAGNDVTIEGDGDNPIIKAAGVDSGDTVYVVSSCCAAVLCQSSNRGVTSNNVFRNINVTNFGSGITGGLGAAQSDNGILENVVFRDCAWFGMRVTHFNALNWAVFGGGAHNCATATTHQFTHRSVSGNLGAAYMILAGTIPTFMGIHASGNGWTMYTNASEGQLIIGGHIEDAKCISAAGPDVFLSGVLFTGGDDETGISYLNTVFSSGIIAYNCVFAPANPIAPSTQNYIVEAGNNGFTYLENCKFEGYADECGLQAGNVSSRISLISCYGSSLPSATTLFADGNFVAVDDYTQLNGCVVADLPTAHAKFKGLRGWVTDANATTYMSTVAGGGSNVVRVFCNGTAWKIA